MTPAKQLQTSKLWRRLAPRPHADPHLGRDQRFREERPTLDDAIVAARRLAAQGDGRLAAVYAVSPEPGHPGIHITNVGSG